MGIVWTCCTGRKELKLIEYMPDNENDDTQAGNINEKIKYSNFKGIDNINEVDLGYNIIENSVKKSITSKDINRKISKIYDEEPIIVEENFDKKKINTLNKYYDEEPQEDMIPSTENNNLAVKRKNRFKHRNSVTVGI